MSAIEFEQTDTAVLKTHDDYQAVFEHCKTTLINLQGNIKKVDHANGLLEAAWRYGINPFGLRGSLMFRTLDDGAISITVKSGFKDSFSTTSAVEKKTQEIIQALLNQSGSSANLPPKFSTNPVNPTRNKTKVLMALLAFLLGGLGAHKFYAGCWGWGIVYLASCFVVPGLSAVIALIEFIRILTLSPQAFDEKYNQEKPGAFTFIW